ncbi:MAG: hypothetical protein CM15mP60_1460 [Alphaproteobacteria bacterium]|nr:MAG: hypothetical protein CM15mP60_1460 [Alphaproteobacteria bacterium]
MQIDMKLSGIIEAARTTAENASLKPLDRNADLREAAEQFEAIFLNEFITGPQSCWLTTFWEATLRTPIRT